MTAVTQHPTPGPPAFTDLVAVFPPSPSASPPVTRTVADMYAALVKRTDLEGHEGDFYASAYNELLLQAGQTDKRYAWAIASGDGSAAPTQAEIYDSVRSIQAGDRTLIVSETMWAKIPGNTDWPPLPTHTVTADDMAGILNAHSASPPDAANYPKFTVTGVATKVGAGIGAYWYIAITVAIEGNLATLPQGANGYVWRLSAEEPSDLDLDLPYGAISDPPWLRADGSNATDATRHEIQGINESVTLDGTFTIKLSASGTYQVQDNGSGTGGLFIRLPKTGADADIADIDRVIHTTTWLELGTWRVVPSGNISKSTFANAIQYTFDYLVVDGVKPANDSTFAISLDGADIHRGELVRQAIRAWAVTVAGKGRGSEGDLWTAAGNDTDASWTSTAAKRAKAKAALNTGRLDKDIAGSGALALTAEELGYDLVRLTGAKTGDRILSVPADRPVGMLVFRNESTGAGHDAKLKVATQADGAAITLPAGDSIVIAHGGSLARY